MEETPVKSRPEHNTLLDTPSIKKLSQKELVQTLREYISLLRERDNDLQLAAEVGQSLLQANEELRNELDRFVAKRVTTPSIESTISSEKLEIMNAELRHELDSVQKEYDMFRSSETKKVSDLQDELTSLKKSFTDLEKKNQGLTSKVNELEKEKIRALDKLKRQGNQSSNDYQDLEKQYRELEDVVTALNFKCKEYEEIKCDLESEVVLLKEEVSRANEEIEEYRYYKVKYEEQKVELDDMKSLSEENEKLIQTLKSKLEQNVHSFLIEEDEENLPVKNTILSEVDDRRKAVEQSHAKLFNKHTSLLKAHQESVKQHGRLKQHIIRLTQLSASEANQSKIKRLEEALTQIQQENKILQNKLSHAETADPVPKLNLMKVNSENELFMVYKSKLDNALNEIDLLKKEIKSCNFLKSIEVDKNCSLEKKLGEMEAKLEKDKKLKIQLQLEIDELKLKLKLQSFDVEEECSDQQKLDTAASTNDSAVDLAQVDKVLIKDTEGTSSLKTSDNTNACPQQ